MSSDRMDHLKEATLSGQQGWDHHGELKLKESVIQRQNQVVQAMKTKSHQAGKELAGILSDMVEIADIILKNTCGIGSAFKLAECDLTLMTVENIERFISLVLIQLAYQYGQLIPQEKGQMTAAIQQLLDQDELLQTWTDQLAQCQDHEDGQFSPVRAGRLLWETAGGLFAVKDWQTNTTARIYYQTAPSQDLIYSIESLKK